MARPQRTSRTLVSSLAILILTATVAVFTTIGYAPGEARYAHTNVERLELESARVASDAYPGLIQAVQAVL